MTIRDNARKGKRAEDLHRYMDGLKGWNIERTGTGSDYYETREGPTGEWEDKYVDVKNGPGAHLSDRQRRKKEEVDDAGGSYEETHYDNDYL